MRNLSVALVFLLIISCSGGVQVKEVETAQLYTAQKFAEIAKKYAPKEWMEGEKCLEESKSLLKKGKSDKARFKSLLALIYFKIATAIANQKVALTRIEQANKELESLEIEKNKIVALRSEAEDRFLKIMDYHNRQSDDALLMRRKFETDREAYLKLSDEEKKKWEKEMEKVLSKDIVYAETLIDIAHALNERCNCASPAQMTEAEKGLEDAKACKGGGWENVRPLTDNAILKAQRLIFHLRVMGKGMENPASSETTLNMVKAKFDGTRVFIGSSIKGIVLSIENPWDNNQGKLSEDAVNFLNKVREIANQSEKVIVSVQSYFWGDDEEGSDLIAKKILNETEKIIKSGEEHRIKTIKRSLGNGSVIDSGPCISKKCSGGRLDVIIIAL